MEVATPLYMNTTSFIAKGTLSFTLMSYNTTLLCESIRLSTPYSERKP